MVLDHFPGDPEHLRWLPGKHVHICPEKSDEHVFLFILQVPRDAGGLGGIRSDLHGLHGNIVRVGRSNLMCPGRHLGSRGGWVLLGTCSLYRQNMKFLNCSDGSGAVTPHGEDTGEEGIFRTKYP